MRHPDDSASRAMTTSLLASLSLQIATLLACTWSPIRWFLHYWRRSSHYHRALFYPSPFQQQVIGATGGMHTTYHRRYSPRQTTMPQQRQYWLRPQNWMTHSASRKMSVLVSNSKLFHKKQFTLCLLFFSILRRLTIIYGACARQL